MGGAHATGLSELYRDDKFGLTLNRVNERTFLLNDLGRWMQSRGSTFIEQEFERCGRRFLGPDGLLASLAATVAYADPMQKKSLFFASLAVTEGSWTSAEFASMKSPVDYHELRGHLRIGTVRITDAALAFKVNKSLPATPEEDVEVRNAVQRANDEVGDWTGLSSSRIHYLMWNVFRQCCPRPSTATHCASCPPTCGLPAQYKRMDGYDGRCVFSQICDSAGRPEKVTEPPYTGHYY